MSGKKSQLTPLETRKQLLLVESELNRVQLLNEVRDFQKGIHHFKQQVGDLDSVGLALAKLATTFSAISGAFAHRAQGQGYETSWISTSLNGLKAGVSLWRLLRSCWRKT